MNRDYFEYLDALGFSPAPIGGTPAGEPAPVAPSMAAPVPAPPVAPKPERPSVPVLFVSEKPMQAPSPAEELLSRMAQAMGLGRADYAVATMNSELPAARETIALGDKVRDTLGGLGVNMSTVISPLEEMLARPELKKSAWSELQNVMSRLSLSTKRNP